MIQKEDINHDMTPKSWTKILGVTSHLVSSFLFALFDGCRFVGSDGNGAARFYLAADYFFG